MYTLKIMGSHRRAGTWVGLENVIISREIAGEAAEVRDNICFKAW